jgi:hypothetical protein
MRSASPTYGPKGYLFGLTLSNGTDTVNDIDIAAGEASFDSPEAVDVVMYYLHATHGKDRFSFPCGWGQPLANRARLEIIQHLGTPQRIVTAASSPTVVWDAVWRPFGEIDSLSATIAFPLRLPGQYFDTETGLHYNYQRDYDLNRTGFAGGSNS